jgi:dihydroorotate dehydrogenase (NAD+) catalytic subunit
MKLEKIKLGNKEVMPFTIPSGIVTTNLKCLEKIANEIPEVGILTTKSIGPEARIGNREPIFAEYMQGGFVNAVGLTNPGVYDFVFELRKIMIPKDKFLLVSIFGKNAREFANVTKTLNAYVDGFELNLSCPHAKGYGMQLGQDPEIVQEITSAVASCTEVPIFAKLTPNAGNIGEIARAAMQGGAYGITAINTVGPGKHTINGVPVLSNGLGGMSGPAIRPIGVKCVEQIYNELGEIPIIGMGGIENGRDVISYHHAGAKMFGIGSALIGMDDETMKKYFNFLQGEIKSNGEKDYTSSFLRRPDMNYKKVKVANNPCMSGCNLKSIVTDSGLEVGAGQFVFAYLPGVGEKPFSVMNDYPLTLGILERGNFTKNMNNLAEGDEFYIRGPYGKKVEEMVESGSNVVLVGGGCGVAGISLIAKQLYEFKNNITSVLGVKKAEDLLGLDEELKLYGKVCVATEDGSLGIKGTVEPILRTLDFEENSYFFNCGPRAMIDAIVPLEKKFSKLERIYSSKDYMTKCGVGICGSCADNNGRRTCVEGPFMSAN